MQSSFYMHGQKWWPQTSRMDLPALNKAVWRLLLAWACLCWPFYAVAAPLRFCYEDTQQQPWTYPDATGLVFDLLKLAEQTSHEKFEYVALPWKRCIAYVTKGTMDGVVGAVPSPERELFARIPRDKHGKERLEARLYFDHFHIYVRKNSNLQWNGKKFTSLKGVVAAQSGFVVVGLLRAMGVQVDDGIKSAEDGLRLLLSGAIDAAVLQGDQAQLLLKNDPRFQNQIKVMPKPFVSKPLYLMVAKTTYEAQTKRIEAIWHAIQEARATPAYQALEKDTLAKEQ